MEPCEFQNPLMIFAALNYQQLGRAKNEIECGIRLANIISELRKKQKDRND